MSEVPEGGSDQLGSRFVRSSLYLGAGTWLTYALNFLINIGVARLLGPTDFGLYALVFAVNEFLLIVGALSMNQALIHLREESQSLYDTAYVISMVQGLASLLMALCIAPILAHYRSTDAAWFIVVLGLARILTLMAVVPWAKLERSFLYGRLAAIGFVTGNAPNLCALALAWLGWGAWSLILRDFLTAALTFVLMSLVSGYRFRFAVNRSALRSLMDFARPMFWARILDIVVERVDRIVVGSVFGDTMLGLYHQARYLATLGILATRPVFQLAFNLYSRVKDQPQRLARSFGIINYFLARMLAAMAVVFLVFPTETIRLLLGEEWIEAGPVLRSLGVYAAVLPIFWNLKQLLFARAEAIKNVRVRIAQAAIFLPGVLIASAFESIEGIAVALTLGTLLATGLTAYYNRTVVRDELRPTLATPTVLCLVTVLSLHAAGAAGAFRDVPWQLLPVLPPLLFAALSLAVERGKLASEFSFLYRQLRSGATAE